MGEKKKDAAGHCDRLTNITDRGTQTSVAERPVALPACHQERAMPIRQYLDGERFDPDAMRVMGLAFEMARLALGARDRGNGVDETVAKRIIELAKAGERDADRLCEYALAKAREGDGNTSQLYQSNSAFDAAAQAGSLDLSQSRDRAER
jgi:hypothetical protein